MYTQRMLLVIGLKIGEEALMMNILQSENLENILIIGTWMIFAIKEMVLFMELIGSMKILATLIDILKQIDIVTMKLIDNIGVGHEMIVEAERLAVKEIVIMVDVVMILIMREAERMAVHKEENLVILKEINEMLAEKEIRHTDAMSVLDLVGAMKGPDRDHPMAGVVGEVREKKAMKRTDIMMVMIGNSLP